MPVEKGQSTAKRQQREDQDQGQRESDDERQQVARNRHQDDAQDQPDHEPLADEEPRRPARGETGTEDKGGEDEA